jgi:ribose transport system permease protein
MVDIEVKKRASKLDTFSKYGTYILFIILIIVGCFISHSFYEVDNIAHVLFTTAPLGISVIGMTFVLMIGGIDLSVGTVVFATGTVSALFCGLGFIPDMLIAIFVGAVIGALNGFFTAKWNLVAFLVTLATTSIVRGATLIATNEGFYSITNHALAQSVTMWKFLRIPVIVYAFFILAIIGQIVLSRTPFGWHLYAIGNNRIAAEKVGINVKLLTFWVYLLSGVFGGMSGFIQVIQIGSTNPTFGTGQEFTIISACVLGGVSLFGGKGKILPGAIVGIFIISIIQNLLALVGANPYAYTIVQGIVIFLAIFLNCMQNKGDKR